MGMPSQGKTSAPLRMQCHSLDLNFETIEYFERWVEPFNAWFTSRNWGFVFSGVTALEVPLAEFIAEGQLMTVIDKKTPLLYSKIEKTSPTAHDNSGRFGLQVLL